MAEENTEAPVVVVEESRPMTPNLPESVTQNESLQHNREAFWGQQQAPSDTQEG